MINIKLRVIKDKDFGIEVLEEDDTNFSLCLFLSDIKYDVHFKELFNEIEKLSIVGNYFTTSYNASRIEISSLGAVIADQEDEYCWFLELSVLKKLLRDWEIILREKIFPVDISLSANLLTEIDYSKITLKLQQMP